MGEIEDTPYFKRLQRVKRWLPDTFTLKTEYTDRGWVASFIKDDHYVAILCDDGFMNTNFKDVVARIKYGFELL